MNDNLEMFRLYIIFILFQYSKCYIIYTVDDPLVCNQSIYLERGPNSAAILKMTSRDSYDTNPVFCTIKFKVPIHNWSGLTGIIEDVDLRAWDDTSHHLGQATCVDFIRIDTEKTSGTSEKQCGTWYVTPGEPLTKLGYNRALVGYCPHTVAWDNNEKCHVTELKVVVSVGLEKQNYQWSNHTWRPHRGFTFVVTAYSYPIKNGESECRDGLRSCSQANTPGSRLGVYHCVHDSLWCDGHVNCGLLENMDEMACFRKGIWGGLVTVVIGPWMGASILLLLACCGIIYWRSSRLRMVREPPITNQEINSYAESYELSSNLSSAHQMAIQVRVVCNSNHPHHGNRSHLQPWQTDLPPSYDALFPQGPPQTYSADGTEQNLTASITATMAGVGHSSVSTLGVNVTATTTRPANVATLVGSRNNDDVITISTNGNTSNVSSNLSTTSQIPNTSNGSSIDLNVTRKSLYMPHNNNAHETRSTSSIDATISSGSNNQASVTLTVTPTQSSNMDNRDTFDNNSSEHMMSLSTINIQEPKKEVNDRNIEPGSILSVVLSATNSRDDETYLQEHYQGRNDNDSCTESDDNCNELSREENCELSNQSDRHHTTSIHLLNINKEDTSEIQTTLPISEGDTESIQGITSISNPCAMEQNDNAKCEENIL